MLDGILKPSAKYRVSSLEEVLQKFFPISVDAITVIDDEEECEDQHIEDRKLNSETDCDSSEKSVEFIENTRETNGQENKNSEKKPQCNMEMRKKSINVPSISEYSLKTQKLVPASSYAKKSNVTKTPISINYKNPKPSISKINDPVLEAVKLRDVKKKIYLKNTFYANDIQRQKITIEIEEENNNKSVSEGDESTEEGTADKCNSLRKRKLSIHVEHQECSNSDDNFEAIPICKSKRPLKKGRKKKLSNL